MTFNDRANFDSRNVRRRRGGVAAAGGGGALALILGFLSMQFLGVDVTQFFDPGVGSSQQQEEHLQCTGEQANATIDCRMVGASVTLEQFWAAEAPDLGVRGYRDPTVILYDHSTNSACGTASNAIGPFYCPADESIYIDGEFFQILTDRFGASGGPLAEMYVLAHEWGHHIQQQEGTLSRLNHRDLGPTSDMVRSELQADCYAGAWMGGATRATDEQGNQILREPTRDEIAQTISAAQAIGDDAIQRQAGMRVQPESFSHGTSEQRTRWLMTGYEQGVGACNTFEVRGSQL